MSNTDGEDKQPLLSNLAKLDKIASKEVSGWHEKSNKRLGEQLLDAEKELASLREQLKQKEDVIRKLIPLARMFVVHKEWMGEECKTEKAIIEKAKSLTTKDK